MVKVGFIVEGATEKIILERSDFFTYLCSLKIDFEEEVIDAEGKNNLLPHKILQFTQRLTDKGVSKIFILTDKDDATCFTSIKNTILPLADQILIVSVKEIEAWFLSDTEAMRKFTTDSTFTCSNPELINEPFQEIRDLLKATTGKLLGKRKKKVLADIMTTNNFSILKAAEHPNCNSAKYFLKKIKELSPSQTL